MKRTCDGCKAMERNGYQRSYYCGLRHPVKNNYIVSTGSLLGSSPLEECEKPTSTKKYAELLRMRLKNLRIEDARP